MLNKKIIYKNIFTCPNCKSEKLKFEKSFLKCQECGKSYKIFEDKKIIFEKKEKEDIPDSLDYFKHLMKRYDKLYNLLIWLISPVYVSRSLNNFIIKNIKSKNIIALNLGSGNSNISNKVINIDIFPYKNTDICCNIANLPFKDNSIDIIFCIAVLEHVPSSEKVVSEIYRVLKKDGLIYISFPFIQGFYASPFDYSRRTYEGMKFMFKDFKLMDLKCAGGPTSGMLWVIQEWIAILISFGNKYIHTIVLILMMILTFPIKFLDIFLINNSMAKNISSAFTYIGKKQ